MKMTQISQLETQNDTMIFSLTVKWNLQTIKWNNLSDRSLLKSNSNQDRHQQQSNFKTV